MTAVDWLSSLDAGFLQVENDTQPMHVGSILLLDGPAPDYADFCAHVESRLDFVPRYRQRVQHPPLGVARPYWVDDPHFSLGYHLRHTAVPQPGREPQLATLAGRIMSQRLDRDRPLWEMWLVEGLGDDRWAVISKVHHAMIDGVSGHEILEILLDSEPDAPTRRPSSWRPRPGPGAADLAVQAAGWTARLPGQVVAGTRQLLRNPAQSLRGTVTSTLGVAQVGRKLAGAHGVLNGPIGPHRRWSWARGDLREVRAVKSAVGCTVNDVVLAAIAGGYRRFLIGRGDGLDNEVVRSLVPVSVRSADQRGRLGNQVTAMFADLPIGISNPRERLAVVAAQMHQLKHGGEAVGVTSMVSAARFVPPTLMTLAARTSFSVGQHLFNTVTTNIPGPQHPLYLLGRRMLEMFPYIPIAEGARISIGIVSYDGRLMLAATGDYDAIPDLDDLSRSIEVSLRELSATVR